MFSCSPVEAVNVPPHDATAASRRTALEERMESLIGPAAIARSATRGLFSSLVAAAAGLAARTATATRTGRPPQTRRRRLLMRFALATLPRVTGEPKTGLRPR